MIIQPSVNNTTTRLALEGPIKELGNVLPRILDFMATVPLEEHIYFSNLDLANGFWCMIVDPGRMMELLLHDAIATRHTYPTCNPGSPENGMGRVAHIFLHDYRNGKGHGPAYD